MDDYKDDNTDNMKGAHFGSFESPLGEKQLHHHGSEQRVGLNLRQYSFQEKTLNADGPPAPRRRSPHPRLRVRSHRHRKRPPKRRFFRWSSPKEILADEYRGARGNDDYSYGSRNRSFDRDRDRSHDDDDRYSSRSDDGKHDDPPQDESRLERKLSKQSVDTPPSYEETIGVTQNQMNEERNGGNSSASARKVTSPTAPRSSSSAGPTAQAAENITSVENALPQNNGGDGFDEFDPQGSVSGVRDRRTD